MHTQGMLYAISCFAQDLAAELHLVPLVTKITGTITHINGDELIKESSGPLSSQMLMPLMTIQITDTITGINEDGFVNEKPGPLS